MMSKFECIKTGDPEVAFFLSDQKMSAENMIIKHLVYYRIDRQTIFLKPLV